MTREEAMLKLLAIEPEQQDQLPLITGWGNDATMAVLHSLKAQGRVDVIAHRSVGEGHRLWYVPDVNDGGIQQMKRERAGRANRRGAAGRYVANSRRKAQPQGKNHVL